MSLFMIETSAVDSGASNVGKLASQVTSLSSSVSGYDVSCNGEFDFESVKNTIVSNLEACVTKISNTSTILNAVSESHTKLQNSLKFNDSSEKKSSKSKSSGSSSGGSGGGYYSSSSAGYSAASVGAASAAKAVESNSTKSKKHKDEKIEFKKVDYVYFDDSNVTEESKKIVSSSDFSYDEKGYGKYNDYYVVAVDESYGKVGDVIRFTKEDGEVVEAVIGFNTGSKSKDETIHFVVTNDEEFKFKAIDSTKNILENNKKVENIGNYEKVMKDSKKDTKVDNVSANDDKANSNKIDSKDSDSSITDQSAADKPESN